MILNSRYKASQTHNLFGSRYSDSEIKTFISLSDEKKMGIRLLKGHMPFGLHKNLPVDARYISILRDPIERVTSQYYYIKKNKHKTRNLKY